MWLPVEREGEPSERLAGLSGSESTCSPTARDIGRRTHKSSAMHRSLGWSSRVSKQRRIAAPSRTASRGVVHEGGAAISIMRCFVITVLAVGLSLLSACGGASSDAFRPRLSATSARSLSDVLYGFRPRHDAEHPMAGLLAGKDGEYYGTGGPSTKLPRPARRTCSTASEANRTARIPKPR